ncbi:MAG: hypothetical protein ACUZ8I_17665, partial [Candidatus Scalindua sp.]
MKSKLFRSICMVIVVGLFISQLQISVFAAETDKDLTLDDGSGDSPKVILRDETGDNTLTLQKMDAGQADITNNEGAINLRPSNDTDDYLYLLTDTNLAGLFYENAALSYTNDPGIRINSLGQIQYRDQDEAGWTTLDSISGVATDFGDLADVSLIGLAWGDVAYYNGSNWVNLGPGTLGHYLQTQGAGANPVWAASGGGDITAVGDVTTGDAFTTGGSGSILYFQGTTSGELTVKAPAAAGTNTITLPAATDTLVGKATTDTLTNKTLTSPVLNTGVSGTAIKDEDDMTSDSATQLATQQSIKAYVDSQVGASGDITAVGDGSTGSVFTADGTGNTLYFEGTTANTSEIALTG